MNIKEVEERTGMARANIRFYESQGLLYPARRENGYRDYSEQDVAELEKLRLLRALDLPLEQVKAARQGSQPLDRILDGHLPALRQESQRLQNAQAVCGRMVDDHVRYEGLDAALYLDALKHPAAPENDVLPRVTAPVRRFFARGLDFAFCTGLGAFLLCLARVDLSNSAVTGLLLPLLALLLTLLLEPLLLHFFGTTPGKWLLGLAVTDREEGRLAYRQALTRTLGVLWYGEGFHLPVYALYRNWKSYEECSCCTPLAWEEESNLTLREDFPLLRTAGYAVSCCLLLLCSVLMVLSQFAPPNRGELTVADFAENFNYLARRQGLSRTLDENGRWVEEDLPDNVIFVGPYYQPPRLVYTTQGDRLTGVRLTVEHDGREDAYSSYTTDRFLLMEALLRAQKGLFSPCHEVGGLERLLLDEPAESWTREVYGVTVTNRVELDGYLAAGTMFFRPDDEDSSGGLRLEFSLQLS